MHPEDDLTPFDDTMHMLEWLHPEPLAEIKGDFEKWVSEQSPGSEVVWLKVVQPPQWLTGGRKTEDGDGQVILVRTGVAFAFRTRVRGASRAMHNLSGVFTWVAWDMDTKPQQRLWIDLDGTLDELGGAGKLAIRIYGRE